MYFLLAAFPDDKGDSQVVLLSRPVKLSVTWTLELLRNGRSIRVFLNQHLAKLSEYITYGMYQLLTFGQ